MTVNQLIAFAAARGGSVTVSIKPDHTTQSTHLQITAALTRSDAKKRSDDIWIADTELLSGNADVEYLVCRELDRLLYGFNVDVEAQRGRERLASMGRRLGD